MNKTQRVKLVAYLSRKLLGYDIFESAKELKHSLENILREKKAKENKDSAEMRRLESEKTALQEEYGAMEDIAHSLEQELTVARANHSRDVHEWKMQLQSHKDAIQRLNSTIRRLNVEIKCITQEKSLKKEEADILHTQNNLLHEQARSHLERINVLSKKLADNKEQMKLFAQEHTELMKLREKSTEMEKLESEKTALQEECGMLKDTVHSLKQELSAARTNNSQDVRELEKQIQDNEETIQRQSQKIDSLRAERQNYESRLNDACQEFDSLKAEKNLYEERLKEMQAHCLTLEGNNEDLSRRLAELETKIRLLDRPTSEQPERKDIPETKACSQRMKCKGTEAIEQAEGSIVDFPPIENDSNKQARRTIEYVYDDNGQRINANAFFNDRSAEEIAQVSRKLSEAEISNRTSWTCGLCRRRVKIAHRTYNGEETLFFIHANRDHYCPWLTKTERSNDEASAMTNLLAADDSRQDDGSSEKSEPKDRELKEKIFALLTTPASEEMGITDVRMDEIIRSKVPYTRWRRPDLSFVYGERQVVIELQKQSHSLDFIVDKDVFYRLNNIQVLWIFGSDSDTSYEYMRKTNYKNTLFDNHRNVFVFDKEAQSASEKEGVPCLKCNWLDPNDQWHFRVDRFGSNGTLVGINQLTYDDEYCKPYYYDANEDYFAAHPEAHDNYLSTRMSRDELRKMLEDKWLRSSSYEEAQVLMRQRHLRATPYCVQNWWGFRFNDTVIIPPIFTEAPRDLCNGFYLVKQDANHGIVNYYGEKIVKWDGIIQCDSMNYDSVHKRLLFSRNGLWGVANLTGKELIKASFETILDWTNTTYRVKQNGKWGLTDIDGKIVTDCIYDKLGELVNSCANATKAHPACPWKQVSGLVGEDGQELYTVKSQQPDGLSIIQSFESWGIKNEAMQDVVPCHYEEIRPWAEMKYRVKENGKWGIIDVQTNTTMLPPTSDAISELKDGVAIVQSAGLEYAIDCNGNKVTQEAIPLQNGWKKTKVAGKWGIVDKDGNTLVNHQYDEIGSFRSRMIGVINQKFIKLNLNYAHPIYISGKLINSTGKCHFINIAGVKCMISDFSLSQAGKSITQIFDDTGTCKQFGFANLIFNKRQYLLRILKPEQLTHTLSHADGKNDFTLGEILEGKITSFKAYSKNGKRKRTKAMVEFPDGRTTMVPRRFFNTPSQSIDHYNVNNIIKLEKIGFDEELDQTIWEVLNAE